MESEFVHLKLHTEYSLLEGVGKIDEYVKKASKLGMTSLAITDVNMFGAIEFFKKCKSAKIKPIIGLEVFFDGLGNFGEYSLTLLAKNKNGYKNLCKLSSISFEKFSRKRNKIKYEDLKKYSQDLYVLSSGLNGEITNYILEEKNEIARKIMRKLFFDFGENFFLEIPASKKLERVKNILVETAKREKISNFVVTNDIYYLNEEDKILKKIVELIKGGEKSDSEEIINNKEIRDNDFYFKDYSEIKSSFENENEIFEKAIKNIQKIVQNCEVDFEFHKFKFPRYELPKNTSEKEFLRKLVYNGIVKRYSIADFEAENEEDIKEIIKKFSSDKFKNEKNLDGKSIIKRAEYELKIIDEMGYNGYFIIVWDFIKFSKENGIYVGPGRGSAAGSIVSYTLNITDIDPIEYNLIFERFLNPERISMPDIDIDFDQEQREQVIDYVYKKYGSEYVAHIITFGTLKARLVIRDVGRVLNVKISKVDKIAKMIPFNMDLSEAKENVKELKNMYETDRQTREVIDYSLKLEGQVRHTSIHAAGIVISKDILTDEIPIYSDGKTKVVATQYQMKELEELGILKMDFLGLKNLTILRKIVENVEESKKYNEIFFEKSKNKVFLDKIPLDDKKTYELLSNADTMGVFQCESVGIRSLMKKMKIESFSDIVALLALYRPGPLGSGMVDDLILQKNSKTTIKYIDDSLKDILSESYGMILYQEQVMKILSELADYTLGEADEVRRAISKKNLESIQKNREKFVKNTLKKGILQSENPQKKANEIYDLIEKFGGYGFNKSHSAAYSLIVYWTAFFKANYPLEFFAAIMSVEVSNLDRFQVFVNEAKKNNIDLLLPDVNICNRDFEVVKNEKEKENKKEREIKEIKKIEEIEEIEKRRERERENKKEEYKEEKLENEEKQYRKENERCGSIRFGFCGIKGIGEMLFQNLSEELKSGKFDSYEDFSMRMKDNEMTEKQFKILIFSGALDKFGKSRKEMLDLVKNFELFDADEEVNVIFPEASDSKNSEDEKIKSKKFSQIELLEKEKKYLGIYVSKHPLDLKKVLINIISHDKIKNISKKNLKTLRIIGMIRNLNIFNTKKGENMAKFELEDFDGNIEIICFQNKYANFKNEIKENEIVILEGNVNFENEKYNIFLENICKLENLEKRQDLKLFIKIDEDTIKKSQEIKKLILKYQGKNKVIQVLQKNQENQEIKKIKKNEFKISKYSINLSLNFLRRLVKLIGFEKLKIR